MVVGVLIVVNRCLIVGVTVGFSSSEAAAEASRRGVEARRRKAAAASDLERMSAEELASLGDETLRKVMQSRSSAETAKVQAAKEWNRRQALVPDVEFDWRRSVQVRPDFVPPSWDVLIAKARAFGAAV